MTAPTEENEGGGELPLAALERSRTRFLTAVARFEPQALDTPVSEGRWSPLQYLEHLVRAEEAVTWRLFAAVEEARRGGVGVRPKSPTPDASIEDIVERTWKPREDAPPLAVPSLGGSREYWMARMRRNGALVASFVEWAEEAELDRLAIDHPISGPLTLRQGIEFLRYHLDRHLKHLGHQE